MQPGDHVRGVWAQSPRFTIAKTLFDDPEADRAMMTGSRRSPAATGS
jgi:hypothetical protein